MVWINTWNKLEENHEVIVVKKIFLVAMVSLLVLTTSTASAIGRLSNSDEVLAEMYSNMPNFIRYGGVSTGLSFLIAKSSLNVEYYSPPTYIISARKITHFNRGTIDNYEHIESDSIIRYKYDYATKKMYIEIQDENGNFYWKYLDISARKTYHDDNPIAAGEFLFYFAYKISFYENPVTGSFKQFLEEGITGIPLTKLDNGGDRSIWHFYNHKTNQIEWWKNVMNKQTKKTDFIRVK